MNVPTGWDAVGPVVHAPVGIALMDRQRNLVYVNPAFTSLLGYTIEDVVGRSDFVLLDHLSQLERDVALSGAADDLGNFGPFVEQYRSKDDRLVWVRTYYTMIPAPDGSSKAFAIFFEDWTEAKAQQDQFAASLTLLETAQAVGGVGTFIAWLTPDKVGIDEWSETCMEIFGYDKHTFDGTNDAFWRRIHPSDLDRVREAQRVAQETGSSYDIQHRIVRPDGDVRWIHERAKVEYRDGAPLRFLGVTRDITHERVTEDTLATSEVDFRGAFDSSAIGSSLANLDGTWIRCNAALAQILDRPQVTLVGKTLADFVDRKERLRLPRIAAMIADERDRESFIQQIHRNDRSAVWVRVNRAIVRNLDTSPRHVLTQFEDITEIVVASQRLEQARSLAEARERITATLNHEIRNPLNAILGFIDLLSHDNPGALSQKQVRYLESASKAAEGLRNLIGESLEMARISSRAFAIEYTPFGPCELLRDAIDEAAPYAATKRSRVLLGCSGQWQIVSDHQRLLQVVRNLITNAIKHTPDGTSILVSAKRDGRRAVITVADDGDGIPADLLPTIYEEFVQIGPDRTGSGLGLAISRQLVRLMGGELSVASAVGAGTEFTISLELHHPVIAS